MLRLFVRRVLVGKLIFTARCRTTRADAPTVRIFEAYADPEGRN